MCFQVNKPLSPLVEQQLHHRPACRAAQSATCESSRFAPSPSACRKIAKITLEMFYTPRRFVIKHFPLCNACKLAELNLGNNALKEVPAVLGHLESLKKLYLFSNQITVVPPEVMGRFLTVLYYLHLGDLLKKTKLELPLLSCFTGGLPNLVMLNLNHNQIQRLPPEIRRYIYGIKMSKRSFHILYLQ